MSTLVRIVTPAGRSPHRLEDVIICPDHLRRLAPDEDVPVIEIPAAAAAFWGDRCLMCGVSAVPGRVCENVGCERALDPQWPAVYCCNDCALDDI